MQNCQVRTVKPQGRINGPAALNRLEDVLDQLRQLHNACLYQYRLGEDNHEPDRFSRYSQQKELTILRATSPEHDDLLRRLQDNVIRHVATQWQQYRNGKRGRPRYKSSRYRTIALDSPEGKVVFTGTSRKALLRIGSLPTMRLLASQQIPTDCQPRNVRIILKGKRVSVRLGYEYPVPEKADPANAQTAVGLDLGIALAVASSTGQAYRSPRQAYLEGQERKTRRNLNRVIAAAMATGRAGFRAVLDHSGKQQLTKKGRPMRQLVWTSGQPTKSYLKAKRRLSETTEKLALLRREFRHRVTTDVISSAVDEGADLLAVEDLQVRSMTASARGTAESPGRNVRAKSGLNRAILQEAWGETLTMLEYKAERAGIPSVRVNAQATSITCSRCGHRDRESRRSQSVFRCTGCCYQANADINASVNIADRGLLYFRKRQGLTIDDLRQARRDECPSGGTEGPETGPAGQPASQTSQESPINASSFVLATTGPEKQRVSQFSAENSAGQTCRGSGAEYPGGAVSFERVQLPDQLRCQAGRPSRRHDGGRRPQDAW